MDDRAVLETGRNLASGTRNVSLGDWEASGTRRIM